MFGIDNARLQEFLRNHFEHDQDWDPLEAGSQSTIENVLLAVQDREREGGPILTATGDTDIAFSYTDDDDGGAYQWQVYLRQENFYLGGNYEEMRKIVYGGGVGAEAAGQILAEAISICNALLSKLANVRATSRI